LPGLSLLGTIPGKSHQSNLSVIHITARQSQIFHNRHRLYRGAVAMNVAEWVGESLEYGRELVSSGLAGAHAGGEAALGEESLPEVLVESAPSSVGLAVIGAGAGILCSYLGNKRKLRKEGIAFGILGGLAGLLVGLGWSTRHLTNGVRVGAMRNIKSARDERWLDRHPIDYA
jgi:hypothetical protein